MNIYGKCKSDSYEWNLSFLVKNALMKQMKNIWIQMSILFLSSIWNQFETSASDAP